MEITIDEIKQHLNIERDYNSESENFYLQSLIDAAKVVVQKHICDSIDGKSEGQLPLAHAVKLLVGTWYMNRESLSNLQKANHSYEYILSLYKNYGG